LRKVTTYVPAAPRRETRNQQQQQQESLNHLKNGHTNQKATCKIKKIKGKKKKPPNKQTQPNQTSFAAAKDGQESDRKTKRKRHRERMAYREGRKGVRAKAGTRNDGGVDSPAGRQAHGIRLSADPR
jgi:hypothetical protein